MATKPPNRPSAASGRTRTARDQRRDRSTSHRHGRTSRAPARSKISLTLWESSGDAGAGRSSIVSSASNRGRRPTAASSAIARLMFSFTRPICETTVHSLPCVRGVAAGAEVAEVVDDSHGRRWLTVRRDGGRRAASGLVPGPRGRTTRWRVWREGRPVGAIRLHPVVLVFHDSTRLQLPGCRRGDRGPSRLSSQGAGLRWRGCS